MPHRKNAKGDIGTAKVFSDSYDADNIYLSEEGWVYRHFKNVKKTMWWDEILVAGQVVPGQSIHGVVNDNVSETNPAKLGTDDTVVYEIGDGTFDFEYAGMPGHAPDYIEAKVETDPKPTGHGQVAWDAINVTLPPTEGDISTQIPDGWNVNSSEGQTDPSDVTGFPDEPPATVAGTVLINQYNVAPDNTPEPGYEYLDGAQDPQGVIVGVQSAGDSSYTGAQPDTSSAAAPSPSPSPSPAP